MFMRPHLAGPSAADAAAARLDNTCMHLSLRRPGTASTAVGRTIGRTALSASGAGVGPVCEIDIVKSQGTVCYHQDQDDRHSEWRVASSCERLGRPVAQSRRSAGIFLGPALSIAYAGAWWSAAAGGAACCFFFFSSICRAAFRAEQSRSAASACADRSDSCCSPSLAALLMLRVPVATSLYLEHRAPSSALLCHLAHCPSLGRPACHTATASLFTVSGSALSYAARAAHTGGGSCGAWALEPRGSRNTEAASVSASRWL